ncbi:hypothetical protein GOP47_0022024 [Adiantum capillus-veneris]|uniref:Uncharacterized protein n=1 Tax=Adiantum capillus-veneris TaxID=13818 RepID=A0A9D4U9F7_ADICA|nr:hypothetical protein GOP47_0022024 [Adiantum capillus-veneris]
MSRTQVFTLDDALGKVSLMITCMLVISFICAMQICNWSAMNNMLVIASAHLSLLLDAAGGAVLSIDVVPGSCSDDAGSWQAFIFAIAPKGVEPRPASILAIAPVAGTCQPLFWP